MADTILLYEAIPLKVVDLGDDTYALAISLKDAASGEIVLGAGTALIGKVQPFAAIKEGGVTELIGIDEQVDQNDFSAAAGVPLGATMSGEILNVSLFTSEDGSGAVLTPDGVLYVFDADPSISSGDTAISAAAHLTEIGHVEIEAADWVSDANGASAHKAVAIAFHEVATLYFAFQLTSAMSFNDAAGDDEQLEFNFWLRRDS